MSEQQLQSFAAPVVKPPLPINFATQSVASMVKTPALPRNPPSGYAKVAAAAVAPSASTTSQASQSQASIAPIPPVVPPTPSTSTATSSALPPDQRSAVTSSPSLTHPSVTSPMLSSAASVSQLPDDSFSAHGSPALLDAVPSSIGAPAATSSPQRTVARKGRSDSSRKLLRLTALSQLRYHLQRRCNHQACRCVCKVLVTRGGSF